MIAEQHALLPQLSLQFEATLRESLLVSLGEQRLLDIEAALPRPLNATSLRVNAQQGAGTYVRAMKGTAWPCNVDLSENVLAAAAEVADSLADYRDRLAMTGREAQTPVVWPDAGVILIPSVPSSREFPERIAALSHEVCVHRLCAESVLRGSDVYIRGVGMVSKGIVEGTDVIISTIVNDEEFPCRGTAIEQHKGNRIIIGWGKTAVARSQLVSENSGVAVVVQERFFVDAPSLNGMCAGTIYAQHLPSIYAVHALEVQPNDIVLDMCASPGGKTSRIAEYVTGSGFVVGVDRTRVKVQQLLDTCIEQGVGDRVYALYADSAKLLLPTDITDQCEQTNRTAHKILASMQPGTVCKAKGFHAETFDRILLDPSCSALGLRPKLSVKATTLANIDTFVLLQRRLFRTAVHLLKVGGTMLYSTCTITAQENETAVAEALQNYPCLRLVPCTANDSSSTLDQLGGVGLGNCGLSAEDSTLVRRFDPSVASIGYDTTGFFCAKFVKVGPCERRTK